jgi:hypothetical protein
VRKDLDSKSSLADVQSAIKEVITTVDQRRQMRQMESQLKQLDSLTKDLQSTQQVQKHALSQNLKEFASVKELTA